MTIHVAARSVRTAASVVCRKAARAVALAVTAAASLSAQRLRGELLMPDSVTRAPGVVVEVLDARRTVVARALSNARGEYDLTLSTAGLYSVRALRIGFRPSVLASLELAVGETRTLSSQLDANRVEISAVSVRSNNVCGVRPDSGRLTAQLWEQVRAALGAAQVTSSAKSIRASWLLFERSTDVLATHVLSEKQSSRSGLTQSPFVSIPPDSLARNGYVAQDHDGQIYYAPDADVLLSESFASQHCFRLEPAPAEHAGWTGLGFSPRPDAPHRYDVDGVLWIDRASAELRALTYHYTGVPVEYTDAGVGGELEFMRVGAGSWIVSRWEIRTARARRTVSSGVSIRPSAREDRLSVDGLVATGGLVTRVESGAVTTDLQRAASLSLSLVSKDSAGSPAGTLVTVVGTDHTAVADSTGRVRIEGLLPGRYRVTIASPMMSDLGQPAISRDVQATLSTSTIAAADSVLLPAGREIVGAVCGAEEARRKDALLYGMVSDGQGRPAINSSVRASWLDLYLYNNGGRNPLAGTQTRNTVTETSGRFHLCGAPTDKLLKVDAVIGRRFSDTTKVTVPVSRPVARVDLLVPLSRP